MATCCCAPFLAAHTIVGFLLGRRLHKPADQRRERERCARKLNLSLKKCLAWPYKTAGAYFVRFSNFKLSLRIVNTHNLSLCALAGGTQLVSGRPPTGRLVCCGATGRPPFVARTQVARIEAKLCPTAAIVRCGQKLINCSLARNARTSI